ADGDSGDFGFPCRDAVFSLDVTAYAGTLPTLDVTIEEKDPVSGTYTVLAQFTFAQIGESVTFVRKVADVQTSLQNGVYGATLRAKWVIGGSAGQSFTFTLGVQGRRF
ncbi:hypothetical protein LCGC14_1303330, partial [marine sediment metagenome]